MFCEEFDSSLSAMLRDLERIREGTAAEGTLSAPSPDVVISLQETLHRVEMSSHGDDQGRILEARPKDRDNREIRRCFLS